MSGHSLEAERLADAVLKAAGSGLRHYSLPGTRAAIFKAAQDGIDAARCTSDPEFIAAFRNTRDRFHRCMTTRGIDKETADLACERADEVLAKAREGSPS